MGLFSGNKKKKLQKEYEKKMKEARDAQRSGDIQLYASLNEEASRLLNEINKG